MNATSALGAALCLGWGKGVWPDPMLTGRAVWGAFAFIRCLISIPCVVEVMRLDLRAFYGLGVCNEMKRFEMSFA